MTSTEAPISVTARVRSRLGEMGAVGRDADGGVTRLAYSESERAAHALFASWADSDGAASVETDLAGNTIAVFRPGSPYFLLGSHLDTVVRGGDYDGTAGVVAALEAARDLSASVMPDRCPGVRVVAFAGEEGARFGRPNIGVGFAAGVLGEDDAAALSDAGGTTLAEAAHALDLDPADCTPWIDSDIACYFELHIEQARQLETGAARIGLVDAIAGSVRLRLTFRGRADHSGATPMLLRRDALAGAAELVLAVEAAARSYRSTVATVGRIAVEPNNVTTVAERVVAWVDVRDVDAEQQRATAACILDAAATIGDRRELVVEPEVISDQAPVVLAAWARQLVHEQCRRMELSYRVLASGAGHDAAVIARRAPATMIFVPCVGGVSHSPHERADAEDIAVGASIMAASIAAAIDI